MSQDLARVEAARAFFDSLQAFTEDVDALIRINRDFNRLSDHALALEEQVLHYRAALHLVGQSCILTTKTALERLLDIQSVVAEALAKYDPTEKIYGVSQAELEAQERLTRDDLAQEGERANHDLEDPNG